MTIPAEIETLEAMLLQLRTDMSKARQNAKIIATEHPAYTAVHAMIEVMHLTIRLTQKELATQMEKTKTRTKPKTKSGQ